MYYVLLVLTNHIGFTLWFTGMSAAGKTTLAKLVGDALRSRGRLVEILDGDEIRTHLSKGLGFSKEDRDANIRRLGHVARLLSRNGVIAIGAAISPYRAVRDEIRRVHESPFVEVYLDCAIDELMKRDKKGLYAKALRGEIQNFTGVSDPYEAPLSPELHLRTDLEPAIESCERILRWLDKHQLIATI